MIIFPGAVIGAPAATVSWTDSAGTLTSTPPDYTFTGMSIGAAHPTRQVFVATYYDVATAVTVNGIAASVVVSAGSNTFRLWRAAVPTGTTASIVVTSGTSGRELISVWAAYNLQSTTPYDTASYTAAANATTHTTSINTKSGGILIATAAAIGTTALSLTGWTGATLRNNLSISDGSSDFLLGAASQADTVTATGATLRTTWNESVLADMLGATFR